MKASRGSIALALVLSIWPWLPAQAGVGIGIGIGPGYCYRPYYCGYGYGCYRPYFPLVVGVGVGPVVVGAPLVQPVTVVQPVYTAAPPVVAVPSAAPPAVPLPPATETLPPPAPGVAPAPLTPTVSRGTAPAPNAEIDRCLQRLNGADDKTRSEAMVELGRLRANQAVEPLKQALASDRSPVVREAAARGLGLIGSPASLTALQLAAQADDDRDVRNSARFAADVIRSRLPR